MVADEFLSQEAERQRKRVRDLGLDNETLRRISEVRKTLDGLDNGAKLAHEKALLAVQMPYNDTIQRMVAGISMSDLSALGKAQKAIVDFAPMAKQWRELNQSSIEKLIRHSVNFDSLRPRFNDFGFLAETVAEIKRVELTAFQRAKFTHIDAHLANSLRAGFEVRQFLELNKRSVDSFASIFLSMLPQDFDYEEVGEDEVEELRESRIRLLQFLTDWFGKLDSTWTTFLAGVTLSLSLAYYADWSSKQMELRLEQKIVAVSDNERSKIRELVNEIANKQPDEPLSTMYVVERVAQLRLNPRIRSQHVATLSANQPVELVARKGEWIYIQYFDYVDGLPKNGWVLKRYLKIANRGLSHVEIK